MVKVAQTVALPAKVLEINEENASAFFRLSVYNQLSVNEARLFVLGISRLRQETGGDTAEITIPARELVRLFGGNKGYYNELDKICRKLCEKQLVLPHGTHQIFTYLRFSAADGGLYMRFNPMVLPSLLADYRELTAREVFCLKSIYAIRIMELIKTCRQHSEYKDSSTFNLLISVEGLKKYLGIPDTSTYRQITNLRNKVLNHSILEINQNGLLHVSYDVVKEGRRVTAFKFTMQVSSTKKEIEEKKTKNG